MSEVMGERLRLAPSIDGGHEGSSWRLMVVLVCGLAMTVGALVDAAPVRLAGVASLACVVVSACSRRRRAGV